MESSDFRKHADAAKPFLNAVKGYVYGPNVEFDNMWNVHEFVHSQITHNQTYAFRLPPTMIEQSRHHVNYHQGSIFSDADIGGIGNIAGRTILRSILGSLSRIAYNGEPLQFFLTEAPYQPFISLFSMLEMDQEDPELRGLRTSLPPLALTRC
jgi:lysosomal acid phosphatase